ncbi:MAG TPA: glycosyltransferase, partial [Thermodesulfobacteriota bacterium]|nr:glycosyltransferase [Thermodesulfobacteriota bacterium]
DERIGWYQHALNEAYRFLGNRRVDMILSSSLPSTVHLIARRIKKKYKLPWVADFRDLWSQNHGYPYGSFRHYLERRLEAWTLKEADALVTVSEPLAAKLSILHRQNRIYSITNGFDPEEFEIIREANMPQKFVITYAGQLHSGQRDPEILFQALEGLIKSGKIDKNKIEVNFYSGLQEAWLYEKVKKYGLHEVVHIHDYKPRSEVLRKEASSSLLLVITWDNPEELGVYTGKVFECLGVRRPILAFGGPAGVLADLLRKTKAGFYTSTLEELKQVLLGYYGEYIKNGRALFHGDEEEVNKYTHRKMADRFARVFEEVLR